MRERQGKEEREGEVGEGRYVGGAVGVWRVHTHLEAHIPAPVNDGEEEVALSVASPEEFVPHLVPDVQQVVCVLACILQ